MSFDIYIYMYVYRYSLHNNSIDTGEKKKKT